jgi:hypothetical protein
MYSATFNLFNWSLCFCRSGGETELCEPITVVIDMVAASGVDAAVHQRISHHCS